LSKEHISEESLICVERKWIDTNLPDVELLQATGHTLRFLSELMFDAHSILITAMFPDFKCPHSQKLANSKQAYSTELANAEGLRQTWMTASNLQMTKYSLEESVLGKRDFDSIENRYGELVPELKKLGAIVELKDAIKFVQVTSKQMLLKDGFHQSFVIALSADNRRFYAIGLRMDDRAGKHIAIRRTASLLKQDSIKWAVMVGEAWIAYLEAGGQATRHASEMPDRKEALVIHGVSCEGSFASASAIFNRSNSGITIEDWREDAHTPQIMLPILKAIQAQS
jgi:hypothetical protein